MTDIAIKEVLAKLPIDELDTSLEKFVEPMREQVPDKRLKGVITLAIQGILGNESPVVTHMAQTVARTKSGVWAAAKRIYRFLQNPRFSSSELETSTKSTES